MIGNILNNVNNTVADCIKFRDKVGDNAWKVFIVTQNLLLTWTSFVLEGIKILAITLYLHHTTTTFIVVDVCDSKNIDGLLHEAQQLVNCP
jgi:hypothetical protein